MYKGKKIALRLRMGSDPKVYKTACEESTYFQAEKGKFWDYQLLIYINDT